MADRRAVNSDVLAPEGGRHSRRWFGTDGVRGIVGESLTEDLVERLGRATTLWSGRGRVLVGRDTRGSGPALEAALTRGIVDAGGTAVLAGVLPTPAVALLSQDLGLVVSASHNPPEYNGVKVFDRAGHKLTDADEVEIESLLEATGPGGGSVEEATDAVEGYVDHVARAFRLRSDRPADRRRLRERRVLGNRARRVRAARRRGHGRSRTRRTGRTSTRAAAPRISRCSARPSAPADTTSGSHSTATATGCWPSTGRARWWTATRSSRSARSRSGSTSSP